MKTVTPLLICCLVAGLAGALSAQEGAETTAVTALEDFSDRVSYALGLGFGRSIVQQQVSVDLELLVRGLEDALEGGEALLSEEELSATMSRLQQELAAQRQERRRALAETQRRESEAFLAANRDKEGVVTLPSGLQYEVLEEGSGAQPGPSDEVTVHYRGTLIDGTPFDSSYERGAPAQLNLERVIPGWQEALPLMSVGSKWRLFVPAGLAYGESGGGNIPPNAALIFEVELLSVGGEAAEPSED